MLDCSLDKPILKNPVKLVVWDLDETFWKGTLSEEGITPIIGNIELVKQLAQRGIISSVCSKNDHGSAMAAHRSATAYRYPPGRVGALRGSRTRVVPRAPNRFPSSHPHTVRGAQ